MQQYLWETRVFSITVLLGFEIHSLLKKVALIQKYFWQLMSPPKNIYISRSETQPTKTP